MQSHVRTNTALRGDDAKRDFRIRSCAVGSKTRKRGHTANTLDPLFEFLPDGILLVANDGQIAACNARAAEMFGYERAALLGQSVDVLVPDHYAARHAHDRNTFGAEMPAPDGGGRPMGLNRLALCGQRKDKTTFPIDIALRRTEVDGCPVTLAVLRDMTERVAMAQQIRHTQRLDAIGKLSSGIAHDFNNALAVIRTNLQICQEEYTSPGLAQACIARCLKAVSLGASVTSRLLAFAREQKLESKVADIVEQVRGTVMLLQHSLGRRIVISEVYDDAPCLCKVDVGQLEHAIINLAINARDAMPDGGLLTFRVSRKALTQNTADHPTGLARGLYVAVEVDDTGTGMSDEVAQRAFEPFFSTKGPGKGTGLGLSTIYGFVRQSAGHLRLIAKPEGGTIAEILLPCLNAADMPITSDTPQHSTV